MMADSNDGIISPVGAVWKYLRQNFPLIELYQADESHPSVAGTYAAACCFYTTFFRRDPSLITFNSTLSTTDAANIRAAAKAVVYDTLSEWHIGAHDPSADFSYADTAGLQVSFSNHSTNATDYMWDFGDGNTSADSSPVHTYLSGGTFHVKLLAGRCGAQDSVTQIINTVVLSLQTQLNERGSLNVYPGPTDDRINLNADADLVGADYSVYDSRGKAVLTGKIDSENTVVSVEGLSSGVYFLGVGGNMKRVIKK
jgi:PKD repeat protein